MKKIITILMVLGLTTAAWGQTYPMGSTTMDGVTYSLVAEMDANNQFTYFAEVTGVDCADEAIKDTNYIFYIEMGNGPVPYPYSAKKVIIPASVTYNTVPCTVNSVNVSFAPCDTKPLFVQFNSTTPPTWNEASFGTNTFAIVPASALSAYQDADGWSDLELQTWDDGGGEPADPSIHDSGDFGADDDNLHWAFDSEDGVTGTLTITGTGATGDDFDNWFNLVPWSSYKSKITSLVLSEGVTVIGIDVFGGCNALTEITFPSTLTYISEGAFAGCSALATIYCDSKTPCTIYNSFGSCDEGSITVYVPNGYEATYEAKWADESCFTFTHPAEEDGIVSFSAENANQTYAYLEANEGASFTDFTIARPIQANGNMNTLCLPFDMDAAQIANSSLNGATIYAFKGVDTKNSTEWQLRFYTVTSITAGKPYLFAFEDAVGSEPNLEKLVFHNITLSNDVAGLNLVTERYEGIDVHGTLQPVNIYSGASSYTNYFLGEGNLLYISTGGYVNPFRAYFSILNSAIPNLAPQRYRIVTHQDQTTDISNVESGLNKTIKRIENGSVIVERNGIKYNVTGQIVK